jgi:hypothetical protein
VRDQVSHPYKTTGKIIVLYTLISVFLDSIHAFIFRRVRVQILAWRPDNVTGLSSFSSVPSGRCQD